MALSSQFMGAVGTAMKDLLLANVASAIGNVSINIFGQTIRPFAFLQQWANDLTDQANQAIADAATAQSSADVAQATATTAQTTASSAQSAATTATAIANSKPSITQIPVGSALWGSINSNEDSTFPRASLNFGSASGTSSGGSSTAAPHTHGLGVTPDYKPAGNGADTIEIGYIRCTMDRTYTIAGFITGGSATWAGITHAFLGVYLVDPTTGNLTLLNPTSAAVDISSSITTANTEQRFSLGYTINAHQGDIFAVALLQVTSVVQTCASLMQTSLTDISPPVVQFPRKNYCYVASQTSMPSTITESSLNYGSSTKIPFMVLR